MRTGTGWRSTARGELNFVCLGSSSHANPFQKSYCSERLLYLEIQYTQEADNAERFKRDFEEISWVKVPKVYRAATTDRVLTMEFIDSFKLTDIAKIEELGLDKQVSERSERALRKTRILAMNLAKWLQTATSTTKLTHSILIRLVRLVRSCFIKICLASHGAGSRKTGSRRLFAPNCRNWLFPL